MPIERPAQPDHHPGSKGILCPYCGTVSAGDPKRCDRCGGHFDPLSRQATQNAMGPWAIRDGGNPFRPGCSYETLRDLIKRGKVTRETILRGPTTRQYWNFASRTPGIANLLGACHNCHTAVRPEDFSCAACGALFTPETDRQHLGLAPVHLLPGQASPEIIAASSMDAAHRRPAHARPATRTIAPAAAPVVVKQGGGRWVGLVVLVLVALGAVAAGTVRFLLPALEEKPAPIVSHAAPPVPRQDDSVRPAPEPVKPEPEPAMPEPATPGPSGSTAPTNGDPQPSPAPGAPPAPVRSGSGPLAEALAAFASGKSDPASAWAALERIEGAESQAPPELAAAKALVQRRATQLRLRSIP